MIGVEWHISIELICWNAWLHVCEKGRLRICAFLSIAILHHFICLVADIFKKIKFKNYIYFHIKIK